MAMAIRATASRVTATGMREIPSMLATSNSLTTSTTNMAMSMIRLSKSTPKLMRKV